MTYKPIFSVKKVMLTCTYGVNNPDFMAIALYFKESVGLHIGKKKSSLPIYYCNHLCMPCTAIPFTI